MLNAYLVKVLLPQIKVSSYKACSGRIITIYEVFCQVWYIPTVSYYILAFATN